ncbi:MAG TPA: hypothetical protein VNM92_06585 [Thermoanaerobaculia bacterium]|nr:hypothetical protein [Thermoanaerobaculia bacterium]
MIMKKYAAHAIAVLALLISLPASAQTLRLQCAGPTTPGLSVFAGVSLQTGSPTPTVVTITSSDEAVATAPRTVTIPASSTGTVFFQITGVRLGTATITASAPGLITNQTCVQQVVPFTLTCPFGAIVGRPAFGTLRIVPQPTDTVITLRSSNPAVGTVPDSVTIPAGERAVNFTLTPLAAGTITLTATPPPAVSGPQSCTTQVGPAFSIGCPTPTPVGGSGLATLTITPQGSDTIISLSSQNTTVATVPATVTIPANVGSIQFSVRGVGNGVATIRATLPSALGSGSVTCNAAIGTQTLGLSCTVPTTPGSSATSSVFLETASPTPTVVTLTSSNEAVATAPRMVTIPANFTDLVFFQIMGVSVGTATITASAPGLITNQTCVQQVVPFTLTCPFRPIVGRPTSGTVRIGAQLTDTVITLRSSDPAVGTVPDSVTIPAGQTAAFFTLTPLTVGTTTVTATPPAALGGPRSCTIRVGPAFSISCPTGTPVGGSGFATLTITPQASDTVITLRSLNTTVATVQNTFTIPVGVGSVQFRVTGVADGVATIQANLPAALGLGSVSCDAPIGAANVALVSACPSGVLQIGGTGTGTLTVSGAQTVPTTIFLNSSNRNIATVPSSVTLPANETTVNFTVTGVSMGTATITTSVPGSTTTCIASVAAAGIPTVDEVGLFAMAVMLGFAALIVMKRM